MVKLKLSTKYCLAFYGVIMLHVSMHELVHHFSAAAICGEWGTKTFNSFDAACSEPISFLSTYAGPLYTFLMMYLGMYWIKNGTSAYKKHLGFATIFAQLPAQRMMGPPMQFNDEMYATGQLYGYTNFNIILVTVIVFAICIPPLVYAYKRIQNKHAWAWFLLYFLLLPYLIFGPVFGGLEYLMVQKGFLDQTLIGIGLLFIINEVVTILLYWKTKHFIDPFAQTS